MQNDFPPITVHTEARPGQSCLCTVSLIVCVNIESAETKETKESAETKPKKTGEDQEKRSDPALLCESDGRADEELL